VITLAYCCDKVRGQFQQTRNIEFTTPLFNYYTPLYIYRDYGAINLNDLSGRFHPFIGLEGP
jgi:hypothetical protein